ncbi:MAG: tol-pal system-associated acyl-CoA thioesterase [Gammaproteobacteria bacterium]|nr:MAG: tol-pal system-associated acyl-CoA thioesterase [Gammaproteobacteria bacterium]
MNPSQGSDFIWPVRVYIEDTDAGGIVFYANYLKYMERARTERIRALGFSRLETIDPSVLFVVHSAQLRYHRPARLDDSLEVTADLADLRRTSMTFGQVVTHAGRGEKLVEGQIRVACIDRERMRPVAMPAALYQALQGTLKESVT